MTPSLGESMGYWRAALAAWGLVAILALAPLAAGAQSAGAIRDIEVVGTQRVDPETVRSYLGVRPGDTLGPRSISEALKSLFETGYFADASIDVRAGVRVGSVAVNPKENA
ncbi:MAG: hypothetical protein F4Y03_06370, partial [Alphaproteobacteria bacterium]|nr:hypothetical protein [Alphaproteobacteria bacterium]